MNLKFILIGLGVAFVLAVVGGFYVYQYSVIKSLQGQIEAQQKENNTLKEQVAGLEIDNQMLKLSNSSLKAENDRKEHEAAQIRAEFEKLQALDADSNARMQEFRAQQLKKDSSQQTVREERPTLFLDLLNKNVKCSMENFENPLGVCINGEFKVKMK